MKLADVDLGDRYGEGAQSSSSFDARRLMSGSSYVQKAKGLFLAAAGVSFLFSIYLWFLVDREQGLFVGLWVPSILSLGALMLAGRGEGR